MRTTGPIRRLWVLAVFLLAMGAGGTGFAQEEAPPAMGAEAERAVDLAVGELGHLSLDPADYRLVEVSLQYHTSPSLWRVTFKPVALMPTPERPTIGAGGEVFVNVDLDTGEIVVTYGE